MTECIPKGGHRGPVPRPFKQFNGQTVAILTVTATASFGGSWVLAEPVSGRVVDHRGEPVSDVQIASNWTWSDGKASAYNEMTVDADGNFSGEMTFYNRPAALVAYAEDYTVAGFATVSADAADAVIIKLLPSLHVTAKVMASELGGEAGWVNSYWMTGESLRPLSAQTQTGEIELYLPVSETWNYWFYGSDVKNHRGDLAVEPGTAKLDMGVIDLPATFIALNAGKKVADWTVSEARGLPIEAAQVSDFKGQWLLVEFWGYW